MFSSITTWDDWRRRADVIESGELPIATYELGGHDAEPITFLHGYPSSSLDVVAVADHLGGDWRVLALDFPGFGASGKPTGHRYSIAAAADAVERMWAERGIVRTALLPHDYGASVGQELLARRREGALAVDVWGAVWMNGGIYPDLHRPTAGQQMLLDPDGGRALAEQVDEGLFQGGIAVTWGTRREMDDAEIHEMWRSMDDAGGVRLMHDLLHYVEDRRQNAERWRAALEESDLPMGFAWGDLDPVSGAHMIERVEERLPDETVVRMDDVGHWPLLEAPDVVADVVRRVTERAG
jgi:pimeloyl-ACP methyl ester carboxylesterase